MTGLAESVEHYLQIRHERGAYSQSDVPEHTHNRGLDALVDRVVAQVVQQNRHDVIAERRQLGAECPRQVADQSDRRLTQGRVVGILKSLRQEKQRVLL